MNKHTFEILKLLIDHLQSDKCEIGNPKTYIGYKEIHDKLSFSLKGLSWGVSLKNYGLEDLASFVRNNNYPAITGLVVSKKENVPSEGYYRANDINNNQIEWWHDEMIKSKEFDWYANVQELRDLDSEIFFTELSADEVFIEGAVKSVVVNHYERNAKARRECIRHYGSDCYVCGFSFEKVYGHEFKDYIHVHHIKNIASLKKEYILNPIEDLRPICPNCHNVVHSKNNKLTVDELRNKFVNSQLFFV